MTRRRARELAQMQLSATPLQPGQRPAAISDTASTTSASTTPLSTTAFDAASAALAGSTSAPTREIRERETREHTSRRAESTRRQVSAAHHPAPRASAEKKTIGRRIAAASSSLSAIVAVGLLAVGTALPAAAVATGGQTPGHAATQQLAGDVNVGGTNAGAQIQAYVAPVDAAANGSNLDRSANYSTASITDMAGTTGISNVSNGVYTNNAQCDVQWPFAIGVPISYGFGPRPGEFHQGVDFTPGNGAHVQAIADGVVRVAQDGYQGYGSAVIIDHVIDGKRVASLYGHMQYGSLQVRPGEHVKVGQYIGRTGNTGFSFGAHTHVEIRANDVTPIDPLPWLRAHNKC